MARASSLTEIGDADGWRCWLCDEPVDPEVICDTDQESPAESAEKILRYLRSKGFLPAAAGNGQGAPAHTRQKAGA
mgnify:CR=1 FL=1